MYIFTSPTLFPSARVLRNKIEEITGTRLRICTGEFNTYGRKRIPVIGIRWGNSSTPNIAIQDMKFNDARLIKIMSNKVLFSNAFKEFFWVPEFKNTAPTPQDFPLLIRTTMTGFGGRGIIPCSTMTEFGQNWQGFGYWVKYVPMSSEFRVHVVDGNILRIFKKVPTQVQTQIQQFQIRNLHNGYKFELVGTAEDSLLKLKDLAKSVWNKAVDILHIERGFFAIDVGYSKERKGYFVLEANTAPSLVNNDNTCEVYAEAFIQSLELE